MSGAIRELFASFGLQIDEKGAKRAEGLIGGLIGKVETLGGLVAGAFAAYGVGAFIEGQIQAGSAVHDTALRLGVTNQELQKFQYLGKLAGVGAEEMAGALGFMNKNAGLAATGNEEAAKTFAGLGLHVKDSSGQVRSASDLTLDFVDKLDKMGSQAERTAAITKVMGRAGAQLLPAFSDGAEGVKKAFVEFQELGGGLSDDFVNAADEAGDSIDRFKFAFGSLKSRIAGAVLPALTKVTAWLSKGVAWITKITDKTNAAKAAFLFLGSGAVVAGVLKLAKVLGLTDGGVMGLVKSLLKFGPIVLLIAALFLVFEDLYTLVTGGDSLIGRLLGDEASKKLVADLKVAFDDAKASIVAMLPDLQELAKTLLTAFVDALPYMVTFFKYLVKGISAAVQLLSGFGGALAAAFKGDWEGVGKAIDKAGNGVFGKEGVFGGAFDSAGGNGHSDLFNTPAWQSGQIGGAHTHVLPAAGSGDVKQTNQISVVVNGGATNAETGRVVAGAITNVQKDKQNTLAAVRVVAPQ